MEGILVITALNAQKSEIHSSHQLLTYYNYYFILSVTDGHLFGQIN